MILPLRWRSDSHAEAEQRLAEMSVSNRRLKIVLGGQSGVDRAALDAAIAIGTAVLISGKGPRPNTDTRFGHRPLVGVERRSLAHTGYVRL